MKAIHLQTDYLTEPLGLGNTSPRFYWHCEGGIKQTAYQIIAKCNGETVWDSGKVESSSMTHIHYEGRPLKSRERVCWSVKLWDENGVGGEIATSWFEMGLLAASDWQAKWISGDYKPEKNRRYPADHFRKSFSLYKQVKAARLYITACGVYEASINGEKISDFSLAPGCTDYRKRLQYQVYDVTAALKQENTLDIMLGDGWFRGSIGCFGPTNVYGRRTSVLSQLEITYTDGSRETICSDETFRWSNDGPIRFNDLKDGEVYDARMKPSYSGKAIAVQEKRNLVSADNVPVREKEILTAQLITTPSGKKVLDFGQNIAGFLSFTVKGKAGQRIRLLMGETLDENGEFTQQNIQTAKPMHEFSKTEELMMTVGMGDKLKNTQPTPRQEILFTCSGEEDHYVTRFGIFGFRYALIETRAEFDSGNFTAIAVYSDMEQTGTFSCSNEKVNKLFDNTLWSMKGNFLDIPTDCPTRERLGWTGDAQIFFNTGAYLMDTAAFMRKWMQDLLDGRMKNGVLPAVVPYVGMDMIYNNTGASAGWGCAAILLPYRYWKRYGDLAALEQCYPLAKSYADFMLKHMGHADKKDAKANPYNKYVYEKGRHLGEWLEPEEFQDKISAGASLKQTEVSTAYFHYDMTCMAEMAQALGKCEEAAIYVEYAKGSKSAYQHLFLQTVPDTDRQVKLVRPLAMGIAEGETRIALETRLAKAAENRNYCVSTGFLSTPFVLDVLTKGGYTEHAYRMLENELAPGWLYEVNQGATTIWETWEGNVSLNHYSPGAVCQWLFDTVTGIRMDGENRFVIAPVPGGTLTHAKASYASIYGKVESSWEKTENGYSFIVSVPCNCTAMIRLPDGKKQVGAGTYTFVI